RHPHRLQPRGRVLHRLPVRAGAHHEADERRVRGACHGPGLRHKAILPPFRRSFTATQRATPEDRKLLALLVCPATRQPVALLDSRGLEALNQAIAGGSVVRGDGSAQSTALREALVTRDRKRVYRVDDGIPVLLAEEAIVTTGVDGFPAA